MSLIKFVRIFLLVLIVLGLGLLITQKIWIPKIVEMILKVDNNSKSLEKLFTIPRAQVLTIADIGLDPVVFSRDGKQFAYIIKTTGNKKEIVVNGKISKPYDDINYFSFSPDSENFLYTASIGTCKMVVFNNTEGKCYDNFLMPPTFSIDGSKYGYMAVMSAGSLGYNHFMVINGNETTFSSSGYVVSNPLFSPDLSRFAYITYPRSNTSFKKQVVVDGKTSQLFNEIENLTFSLNNKHFAYSVYGNINAKSSYGYVLDGKFYPTILSGLPKSYTFSNDGNHFGYIDQNDSEESYSSRIIIDNKNVHTSNDFVQSLVFSPDGNHWAYSTWGNKSILVRDGMVVDSLDNGNGHNISLFGTFSFDGKHFAEVIDDLDSCKVKLDGKEVGLYTFKSTVPFNCSVDQVTFSQNNKHLAYIVGGFHQGSFVVVDGKQGLTYDSISNLHFDSNDNTVVYNAILGGQDGEELSRVVESMAQ